LSAFARQIRIKEVAMSDNRESNGNLGAFLGALLAVALAVFMINGGGADLPPVENGKIGGVAVVV